MIWTLSTVDPDLIAAFQSAGEPDQAVIDAYMQKLPRRRHYQPERPGVKRWYYLMRDNPRISLAALGMPLEDWQGPAFFVGTRAIIGEFPGNRAFVGKKGLQMKMQPLTLMTGQADYLRFASGRNCWRRSRSRCWTGRLPSGFSARQGRSTNGIRKISEKNQNSF